MLLVDIGNSRIKWGRWSSGQLQPRGSIDWHHDELECSFDRQWNNVPIPARIIVSNVTGHSIADRLSCWTEKRWAVTPKFVSVQAQAFGVRNGYTDPKQLGIDRWLALIAVWNTYKSPACIVDCGTAVTIDALSASGEHLGGLILPGLTLMQQALVEHTYRIQASAAGQPRRLLAYNTEDGITAGSYYALTACIDRVAGELRERFGAAFEYIITGGDAESFLPLLVYPFTWIPDLVLRGLAIVAGEK